MTAARVQFPRNRIDRRAGLGGEEDAAVERGCPADELLHPRDRHRSADELWRTGARESRGVRTGKGDGVSHD
jgi:hypothetical protein